MFKVFQISYQISLFVGTFLQSNANGRGVGWRSCPAWLPLSDEVNFVFTLGFIHTRPSKEPKIMFVALNTASCNVTQNMDIVTICMAGRFQSIALSTYLSS